MYDFIRSAVTVQVIAAAAAAAALLAVLAFQRGRRARAGQSAPVRELLISGSRRNLIVMDKENGGKADALNAGLNTARFPLVCCVDADGLLAPDALKKLACQFARDERVVAAGGVVRPLNGCEVSQGEVLQAGVPATLTGRVQVVEYLRAFLSGRFGWETGNGLLIVSGAFVMFRKRCCWTSAAMRTAWERTWS